jgi:nucleoside-diphosphate-sugar epimerase
MSIALVTGSAGLIGSEACTKFSGEGFDIVGIDNDMRARFLALTPQLPRLGDGWKRPCQGIGTSTWISAITAKLIACFASLVLR